MGNSAASCYAKKVVTLGAYDQDPSNGRVEWRTPLGALIGDAVRYVDEEITVGPKIYLGKANIGNIIPKSSAAAIASTVGMVAAATGPAAVAVCVATTAATFGVGMTVDVKNVIKYNEKKIDCVVKAFSADTSHTSAKLVSPTGIYE